MKYVSLLPDWAYLDKEMEEIDKIAIDKDEVGYYYID